MSSAQLGAELGAARLSLRRVGAAAAPPNPLAPPRTPPAPQGSQGVLTVVCPYRAIVDLACDLRAACVSVAM